jgi:uncharacterized protein with ParB-like and HNH nuclease domain
MERVDYESLIISDLLNFHSSKSLDINPWYQRRSVWSTPQKAYLINTIFERKPVPSIYIRQKIDLENEKSIKQVVDGQQRVRTILSYRADEFAAKHPGHRGKVKYSELTNAERAAFLTTALSVGYLIGAEDQDVIEIFGRINSVSKSLNPMEKLNALYSGEFKQFCLKQAAERLPFWRATGIFTANEISRMQEVQFASDLVINLMQGLSDYSPTLIRSYYKEFDEAFPREAELLDRMNSLFEKLVALDPKLFSDTIFKSAQVTFSLMVVLDELRAAKLPNEKIQNAIRKVDAEVAVSVEDKGSERAARVIIGFTAGNLHRIRARRIRDEILKELLE